MWKRFRAAGSDNCISGPYEGIRERPGPLGPDPLGSRVPGVFHRAVANYAATRRRAQESPRPPGNDPEWGKVRFGEGAKSGKGDSCSHHCPTAHPPVRKKMRAQALVSSILSASPVMTASSLGNMCRIRKKSSIESRAPSAFIYQCFNAPHFKILSSCTYGYPIRKSLLLSSFL